MRILNNLLVAWLLCIYFNGGNCIAISPDDSDPFSLYFPEYLWFSAFGVGLRAYVTF